MEKVNLEVTPEVMERLKASRAVGFNLEANFKYVLKSHRDILPKNLWPVFTLRGKNGIEISELEDKISETTYTEGGKPIFHFTYGRHRLETLRAGIVSVKGFPTEDGKAVNFSRKAGDKVDELLKLIPADAQVELQNAINEQNKLSEDELRGLD